MSHSSAEVDFSGSGLDLADSLIRRSLAWSAQHDRLDPEQSAADYRTLQRLDQLLWPPPRQGGTDHRALPNNTGTGRTAP